jgi:hypothetical protein
MTQSRDEKQMNNHVITGPANTGSKDFIYQTPTGWWCIVSGRIHGFWRSRGEALGGMLIEQRRVANRAQQAQAQHEARGREHAIAEGRER